MIHTCPVRDPFVRVEIETLRAHACPITTPPWTGAESLTRADVDFAFSRDLLIGTPVGVDGTVEQHARRIAYLLQCGWNDPIAIDAGAPWAKGWKPGWIISDGNHRLYAAIMRGDTHIDVDLSGCLETARDMLGINAPK